MASIIIGKADLWKAVVKLWTGFRIGLVWRVFLIGSGLGLNQSLYFWFLNVLTLNRLKISALLWLSKLRPVLRSTCVYVWKSLPRMTSSAVTWHASIMMFSFSVIEFDQSGDPNSKTDLPCFVQMSTKSSILAPSFFKFLISHSLEYAFLQINLVLFIHFKSDDNTTPRISNCSTIWISWSGPVWKEGWKE